MKDPALQILLADDSEGVRKSFDAILQSLGHQCQHAADGIACRNLVQNPILDLILVDLFMPNFDIYEFLALAQNHPNKPAVVIISAQDDDREMERLLIAGAYAYLIKPVELEDIETLLVKIAEERNQD